MKKKLVIGLVLIIIAAFTFSVPLFASTSINHLPIKYESKKVTESGWVSVSTEGGLHFVLVTTGNKKYMLIPDNMSVVSKFCLKYQNVISDILKSYGYKVPVETKIAEVKVNGKLNGNMIIVTEVLNFKAYNKGKDVKAL